MGAVIAWLALAAASVDTLAVHLADGAKLIKTCSLQCRVELTSVEESYYWPLVRGSQAERVGRTRLEEKRIVAVDEYDRREESSWTVRRSFQEIQGSRRTQMDHGSMEREGSSKLADETVVLLLTLDDEGAFVDPVGGTFVARDLLPGLGQEMNFRGLLPPHPVSPGSRWEVDVEALKELLIPGGELRLIDDDDCEVLDTLGKVFLEDAVGSVTLQYVERLDNLAKLSLRADIESSKCLPPVVSDVPFFARGDAQQLESFLSRVYLEGELLWDLDAGRLQELELAGDVFVRETISLEAGILLLSCIATWEGSLCVTASVEAEPP